MLFSSQELERLGLGDAVELYVREVPVEYQAVQGLLSSLWREHSPQVQGSRHNKILKSLDQSNLTFSSSVFWVPVGS